MAGMGDRVAAGENNILVDRTSYLGSRIRVSLDFVCENSTNLQEILVHLLSEEVLSQHEAVVIENQASNYDRFRKLFTFLIPRLGHGDNSQHFVNAFQRSGNEHILEKLAAVTTDFAPGVPDMSSLSVRFNVREPVQSFVGREEFLRGLHQHNLQHLQSQRTDSDASATSTFNSRICVLTGLGGVGKTETIRKYIDRYGHCYQNLVWIDAEEHKTAENQFRKLELQLSSKDQDNKVKDFDVILKEIYDRLCTSRTLIVLDNAEVFHDCDPKRPGIARFLPTRLPPTHLKPIVLITSRQLEWPDLQPTPLPLFTTQESSAFLFRQLKLEESDNNGKDAETLSNTFGRLPLALQAAAAVLLQESKRNKLMGKDVYTIQHLLSDYNQEKRKVLEKRPPGSPDARPLMFLWKESLDKIHQQPNGHLATQILDVMAHLSPTNIPKELLFFIFNTEDSDSLVDAVTLLVDYSFVQDFPSHFSIHRMLQDVTLAHFESSTAEHTKEKKLLLLTPPLIRITTALKKYWPTLPKSSEAYNAVHDNLVHVTMTHVLPQVQNPSEVDFRFIEFIEFVLEETKGTRRVEAEKCYRVLIAYFTSSALPSNSASRFQSTNFDKVQYLRRQLSKMLREMGRPKEAVDICQEFLSSVDSLEDRKDVMEEILATKNSIAMILMSQGNYEDAIKLYSSILDLRSKLHGSTHTLTLEAKNNLAVTLEKKGRLSEAKNPLRGDPRSEDEGPGAAPSLHPQHQAQPGNDPEG